MRPRQTKPSAGFDDGRSREPDNDRGKTPLEALTTERTTDRTIMNTLETEELRTHYRQNSYERTRDRRIMNALETEEL